jgi:hypothetical protein
MGIFDAPERTIEDTKRDTKASIGAIGLASLTALAYEHKRTFDMVWHNEDGLIPQDVMDAYGNEAYLLFVNSKATQDFLAATLPDYEALLPPVAFTINEDGTVTINA